MWHPTDSKPNSYHNYTTYTHYSIYTELLQLNQVKNELTSQTVRLFAILKIIMHLYSPSHDILPLCSGVSNPFCLHTCSVLPQFCNALLLSYGVLPMFLGILHPFIPVLWFCLLFVIFCNYFQVNFGCLSPFLSLPLSSKTIPLTYK